MHGGLCTTALLFVSYSLISPQSSITTFVLGLSPGTVGVFSIAFTTSIPSTTFPKTTCLPSNQEQGTVVMKNWLPFAILKEY